MKVQTHIKPQALHSILENPVTLPVPGCPCPAHLKQTFCKWLISFEVRCGPQSSLSRNWDSWISKSLGECTVRIGPESGGWGEQRGIPAQGPGFFSPVWATPPHTPQGESWPRYEC